jgi:uncharacterized Zn finger protein
MLQAQQKRLRNNSESSFKNGGIKMAMTFQDNILRCSACGNANMKEEKTYVYSKEKDKLGEYLKRQISGVLIVCSSCGKIHSPIDEKTTRVIDVVK